MTDLDTLIDTFAERGLEGERPWQAPADAAGLGERSDLFAPEQTVLG